MSFRLERLAAGAGGDRLQRMTFPAYRHLLSLERQSRHPELGETRLVEPYGRVALESSGAVAGLALCEQPVSPEDEQPPQLLSVFVRRDLRGRGLGGELVAAAEADTLERGGCELAAIYTTGGEGVRYLERILTARGWEPPVPQSLSVRFDAATALTSPAFRPEKLRAFGEGLELVAWSEVTTAEIEEIRSSDAHRRWIEPALVPWQFDPRGLDPSSVGARHDGAVVGWVLNHRVLPDVVRFSISYMRKDLSRRARILVLFQDSVRRVAERGDARFCTFITPFSYPNMIRFIRRWIAPISFFVEESRRVRKALPSPSVRLDVGPT